STSAVSFGMPGNPTLSISMVGHCPLQPGLVPCHWIFSTSRPATLSSVLAGCGALEGRVIFEGVELAQPASNTSMDNMPAGAKRRMREAVDRFNLMAFKGLGQSIPGWKIYRALGLALFQVWSVTGISASVTPVRERFAAC